MKAKYFIAFCVVVLTAVVHADEDLPIGFKTIEYTLNASNSVTVEVETLSDSVYGRPWTLRGVIFMWDGDKIAVPTNILAEMLCPRLSSIDIQAGAYHGVNSNASYRHLSVEVCDPRPDANNVLDPYQRLRVMFLFWGGRLREIDVGTFGETVWHADHGFSWNGVPHQTLSGVLDAMGKERTSSAVADDDDPFAVKSKRKQESKKKQDANNEIQPTK